jgi:hypothetical protein
MIKELKEDLAEIVDLMMQKRIQHLTVTVPGAEPSIHTVIELHPSAFAPVTERVPEDASSKIAFRTEEHLCACGHDLLTEHNESGCLHGCSAGLCSSGQPEPEEQ